MVTTCNTNFDTLLTQIATYFGKSNNQVFDMLLLQTAQRLSGNPTQFDASGLGSSNSAATFSITTQQSPGNPNATNVRGGWGQD